MNLARRMAFCVMLLGNSAWALTGLQEAKGRDTAPQVIDQRQVDIGPCKHKGYLEIVVALKVTAQGLPVEVRVKKSSGFKCVDEASVAAVRGYRFRPATRDGQPVEAATSVGISFENVPDQKRGRD